MSWTIDHKKNILNQSGEPRLLLGGQVHNSTPTDRSALQSAMQHIASFGGNTVLAPVSWQLTEPVEGEYDFEILDHIIELAVARDLRVGLLWFGAFKNAASTYAPTWVREDRDRFPRADIGRSTKRGVFVYEGAMPKPVLSVFSAELRQADARAFAALMRHVSEHDDGEVIALAQVENEVGLLGSARDRSAVAEAEWQRAVPTALLSSLSAAPEAAQTPSGRLWRNQGSPSEGTWAEVLGQSEEADEIFMAAGSAHYVDAVARAGKAQHLLPMYVNAWLGPQPGQAAPGDYPSGGPTSNVLDVWRACAPAIDFQAPDIYVDDSRSALETYAANDNMLFVPESRPRVGELFRTLGSFGGVGFSCFGVEDLRAGSQLAQAFSFLAPMESLVVRAQADNVIAAVILEDGQREAITELCGMQINLRRTSALLSEMLLDAGLDAPPPPPAGPDETAGGHTPTPADSRPSVLLLWETEDTLVMIGTGITVDVTHPVDSVEIDTVEHGFFLDGEWHRTRVINGDERLVLLPLDRIGIARMTILRHCTR